MLAPIALAAAALPGPSSRRGRRAATFAGAVLLLLLPFAAERRAATGRFAISTEHGGFTLLGTMAPGSAAGGWVDPTLYAASVDPGYLRDPARLRRDAGGIALGELRRRWRYHAYRMAVSALTLSVDSERQNLWWSLEAPGALPPTRSAAGAALARRAAPWLRAELALFSGAFAAAVALAWRRRDRAILVIASSVLLKVLVQVLFSPLGRLMVPAIALELLAVGLGAALAAASTGRERAVLAAVVAIVAAALLVAEPPLRALAIRRDEAPPVLGRFPLAIAGGGGAFAECTVEAGRLRSVGGDRAWLDASEGAARVACRLPPLAPDAGLVVDLESADFAPVRIQADGRERLGTEPGSAPGWRRSELEPPGAPAPSAVVLGARAPFGFGFLRRSGAAPPLPRDRVLP